MQELLVVRRVPAAYKQALAECVRRCEEAPTCIATSMDTHPVVCPRARRCKQQCVRQRWRQELSHEQGLTPCAGVAVL